jgi:L-alanine-DL-glutamate epimerase-like enolase superfamily enzyme
MSLFDRVAELPLVLEEYALDRLERDVSSSFTRVSTVVKLYGMGTEGVGEDVVYDVVDHDILQEAGPVLPLAGDWTLGAFCDHVESLDAFPQPPQREVSRRYRHWTLQSAALDLALRQAGRPLHEVLGREPRPLRFSVSLRLGEPPSAAGVTDRLAGYGDVRFKLDAEPDWDDALIDELAGTGTVDVIDFKGAYKGTIVDVETDPAFYRRIAETLPDAWLEDPDLTDPEADAVLEPHRDRITWDAPIHSIADIESLAFPPRSINVKPSRFGSTRELFAAYDYCGERGIEIYGGGQSELGVGRGQIQYLASVFHPDGVNDIAPAGYDWAEFPTGLPPSPLAPDHEPTGFRRRT